MPSLFFFDLLSPQAFIEEKRRQIFSQSVLAECLSRGFDGNDSYQGEGCLQIEYLKFGGRGRIL